MTTSDLRRAFDRLGATTLLVVLILASALGIMVIKYVTIIMDAYR